MQSSKLNSTHQEVSPSFKHSQFLRFHYLGFNTFALKTAIVIATLLTLCDAIALIPTYNGIADFAINIISLWTKALVLWYIGFLLIMFFASFVVGEISLSAKGIRLGGFSKLVTWDLVEAISLEPQKLFGKLFSLENAPIKLTLFIARSNAKKRWRSKELPSFFFAANEYKSFIEKLASKVTNLKINSQYYLVSKNPDLANLKRNYCFYHKQRFFITVFIALSLICFLGRRTYVYYVYNQANTNMKRAAYQSAMDNYSKATTIDPYFAYAWHNLATAEFKLGYIPNAIEHWQKALALKPDFVEPKVSLAYCYLQNYDYVRARQQLDKALKLAPNDPYVLINSAQVSMRSGNIQQAMRTARLLLALDNKNTGAVAVIAQARIRLGRPEDALKLLNKASKNNRMITTDIYCQLVKAEALAVLNKLDQAELITRKLSYSQPNNADIFFDLADIFMKQGKVKQAKEILVKAEQLQPKNPRTLLLKTKLDLAKEN